jgi:hypothetical protein
LKATAWLRVTQSGNILPRARTRFRNILSFAIERDYTGTPVIPAPCFAWRFRPHFACPALLPEHETTGKLHNK